MSLEGGLHRAWRAVVAAACLLALVLGGLCALALRAEDRERAALTSRFDARQATAARFIGAYVNDAFAREVAMAHLTLDRGTSPADFRRSAQQQGFLAALLLDRDGRVVASHPADPRLVGQDLTGRYPHLRSAVDGTAAVSGVVPSATAGAPVVAFAVPFSSSSGRRVFSGAYAVTRTPLAPFVRNATPFSSARVALVDAAGNVVAANVPGASGRPLTAVAPELAGLRGSRVLGSGSTSRYAVSGRVPGTTWSLVFDVSTQELLAPVNGTNRWVRWLGLLAVAVVGALGLALLYRYLVERARLLDSEARRRAILDGAGDAFIGTDQHGRITEWNAAAARLLGWDATHAIGQPLLQLLCPPEQRQQYADQARQSFAQGRPDLPAQPLTLQALRQDGVLLHVEATVSCVRWGSRWVFHAFLRDVTQRLHQEQRLRGMALTDPLTGLANRRAALARLEQALARSRRNGTPVAVVYVDVDRFKLVNDHYGHGAGDTILITVAQRLSALFRTEDTVARLGGDEFAVVCEDFRSTAEATTLAARVRTVLAQPYPVAGQRLAVTASVGLALSDGASTVEALLDHADVEMYRAKANRPALTGQPAPPVEPGPGAEHEVHFYADAASLAGRVAAFLVEPLRRGEAAMVVASAEHRGVLAAELTAAGLDLPVLRSAGQYLELDAEQTLATFMTGSGGAAAPDASRFTASVGRMVGTAIERFGALSAYGEMVGVLSEQGEVVQALELERLWGDLLATQPFRLLCGYPHGCVDDDDATSVHAAHDDVPLAPRG